VLQQTLEIKLSKDVDHGQPLNPAGLMWCVVSVRAVRGLARGARALGGHHR
jgi:hypothetical protein